MTTQLVIEYVSGSKVSINFDTTVEARKELNFRTKGMTRQGNGAAGVLLENNSNKIIAHYTISEGTEQ